MVYMDWLTLFYVLHIIGVALGVGGATVSDYLFFRSIRDRKISSDEFSLLQSVSRILWTGLTLLIFSGIGLLAVQYLQTGSIAVSGMFYAKMTIVLIILLNGLAFKKYVFPTIKARLDSPLDQDSKFVSKLWILSLIGTISIVSWYSTLLLGALRGTVDLPYLFIMTLYIFILSGGAIFGYLLLSYLIFAPRSITEEKKTGTRKGLRWRSVGLFAVGAAIFLFGALFYFSQDAKSYHVCINEAPPWFRPDVLKIKPGDKVVWEHCPEKTGHAGEVHNPIHTHPILSIEGPEEFSTHLRPVGHGEGGRFEFKFTKPGIYTYICPTHPYMKGQIAVDTEPQKDRLWPPEEIIKPSLLPPPSIPGIGEIWINTQYEVVPGQDFPGTITVVDAKDWSIKKVITHPEFNNPHNPWHSYDRRFVFQTQWHADKLHKIDTATKEVVASVSLGNAPAHVFVSPKNGRVYATINNENKVIVLDQNLNILKEIKTSFGPHGMWIDPAGRWLSVAATLSDKLDIIDLEKEEVVATFEAPGLPLATAITNDGRYAMISLLLDNKVRFIDLSTLRHVKDVEVGKMPIWPAPAPDGKHVFVPNTGTADISVISLETLEVVKTIPAAGGAHGITFGPKKGGGYYGYFSNKFARVMGIVDVEKQELAGYVKLPEAAWGGNGILVLPNSYDEFITQ
jgi:DNA-binding beta-propeller fold protein YncE/plastocyanin